VPPSLQDGKGKLTLTDAENAWFVRVNHLEHYGTDVHLEKLAAEPPVPLLFLSIDAVPGSRALVWEHIEDAPGKRCPNPRLIIPRKAFPGVVEGAVTVDIRSFGVRTPPCTKEKPTYGILGVFHILPPSLAWLWRLVSPRGHANPSIVDTEGMTSEGVGSYWPFATGRRVDQANLLLRQFAENTRMRHILCPNQHIGAWRVGFMPQWIAREYLARRGAAKFRPDQLRPARCPAARPHAAPVAGGRPHDHPLVSPGGHAAGSRRRSLRPGRGNPAGVLPQVPGGFPRPGPRSARPTDHHLLSGWREAGGLRAEQPRRTFHDGIVRSAREWAEG
jgi:hypothetical protein